MQIGDRGHRDPEEWQVRKLVIQAMSEWVLIYFPNYVTKLEYSEAESIFILIT